MSKKRVKYLGLSFNYIVDGKCLHGGGYKTIEGFIENCGMSSNKFAPKLDTKIFNIRLDNNLLSIDKEVNTLSDLREILIKNPHQIYGIHHIL